MSCNFYHPLLSSLLLKVTLFGGGLKIYIEAMMDARLLGQSNTFTYILHKKEIIQHTVLR